MAPALLTINGNTGTFSEDPNIGSNTFGQGTGILLWFASQNPAIEITHCNIRNNIGGDSSIVYIEDYLRTDSAELSNNIAIISSNFTNNYGPALYLSNCNAKLEGYSLFSNNAAQSGSAIFLTHSTQVIIVNDSTLEFTNNVALLYGGAIYIDLSMNCSYEGVTFKNLQYNSLVLFTNNSAGIAGNSLYFSVPESCNIITDSSDSNSIVYIPYQFTYVQLPGSVVPQISTSPYAVNLCSTRCNIPNENNCYLGNGSMLGQAIYFNATACDYFNNVSEPVQFAIKCTSCNNNYRLSDSKILAHNGVSELEVLAVNANSDVPANRNITIKMTSITSHGYKQLSAVASIRLSPCHSGYIFDTNSQQCKCYDQDQNVMYCQQDYVEIKYGYWFGTVTSFRTFSMCPTYYCDFDKQTEQEMGFISYQKNKMISVVHTEQGWLVVNVNLVTL